MMKPGPSNHIIDVKGIRVGHAHDEMLMSGMTVVLPDQSAIVAADCRGGAPGTRETDVMRPENLVEHAHAIVLSGGSAPELESANGVSDWLRERKRGLPVGGGEVIPIVPAAVLFDLNNGGDKTLIKSHRYYEFGYEAASSAGLDRRLGNVGAGIGAKSGKLKGGLGSASIEDDFGMTVGAMAAVNSFGMVTIPGHREFWAWPFERNGEFGGLPPPCPEDPISLDYDPPGPFEEPTNTTLCVVAVNALLTRPQALRMAIMAHDGLARAIRPVHTPFDGDMVFLLATGEKALSKNTNLDLTRIGMMTADCVCRSVARGVYEAQSLGRWSGYRSHFPPYC